jgi:sterol desaturase/sphingolipid hydroxylase (fatty acid hydroxylase superfamily)
LFCLAVFVSVSQFVELVKSQVGDYGPLQLSFFGFFITCALESLVTRKRLFPNPPPELVTDMFYFLFMPTVRITSRILGALILFQLWSLFGAQDPARLMHGFGPLSRQPKWLLVIELVVLIDLSTYWMHRAFHTFPFLWRFHALHHSAKFLRWTTTGRVHPVNEAMNYLVAVLPFALIGFPVHSIVVLTTPLVILFAVGAHTQWDISFGPLSTILVSPRFHHWHHTHSDEGGNKNFANVFSLWDRLFGTYYLPAGRSPEKYGLDVDDVPETYLGQLLYPWRRPLVTSGAEAPSATQQNADPQISKVM